MAKSNTESAPSVLTLKDGAALYLFGTQCAPLTQESINAAVSEWLTEKLSAEELALYFV